MVNKLEGALWKIEHYQVQLLESLSSLCDHGLTPSTLMIFSCLPSLSFFPFLLRLPLLISEHSVSTPFSSYSFSLPSLNSSFSLPHLIGIGGDLFDKALVVLI